MGHSVSKQNHVDERAGRNQYASVFRHACGLAKSQHGKIKNNPNEDGMAKHRESALHYTRYV